ncbi:MAG: hypothetical protein GWN01_16225 [Nitrosopumilaceae archaeon]|nr:hypothetical protein [Nitrosopumilaceae archaeon]NIU02384.1 hypothetical protein [Nitrosopumilaceae archaeon]NIU88841.1 hypothetical protein [Nitrosopumilaceae archaeon]NIV66965.1 hypothetical protein [Nitrosopumilaceae archaeon]NIX62985.1 hypothetical protein [Nitrosopumilaceae archaeon]
MAKTERYDGIIGSIFFIGLGTVLLFIIPIVGAVILFFAVIVLILALIAKATGRPFVEFKKGDSS